MKHVHRAWPLAPLFALFLIACGTDRSAAGPQVVRSTLGDTLVVRTVSGSMWVEPGTLVPDVSIGEMDSQDLNYLFGQVTSLAVGADGTIYVLDRQAAELRAYAPDGTWRKTLGKKGEGPGELKQPNAVGVLSDGRILVRDPGNGRVQVYAPDGSALEEWPVVRGGFQTSDPLWIDREDNSYIRVLLDPTADLSDWRMGLARIAPDGTPQDTLPYPRRDFKEWFVEARSEDGKSASRNTVPFAPSEAATFHPDGYFIDGVSTDYRIDLLRTTQPPLRIERAYEPLPVAAGEKEAAEQSIIKNFRRMAPGWKWNGPGIPDQKPPFGSLMAGLDGRIWVQVPQTGVEEENPDYDPKDPDSMPTRWRQPVVLDVFLPDGTYLGDVQTPKDFSLYPTPVFKADTVWAVTRDDLGVQRVVRFHVQHPDRP
ncbi:MAG: hypothetical protein LJF04_17015 [Gemmatimonadetes bacterium]|nr:hypothetical protein [Gemmatimonadota bacterium]